ncbi:MAG: T9SS type A sorting domain-containing protein, partial [Bacteroidota bacterium]|nr:T9SS type A sorting domain-containing protein [Bacteroidota bacterium]
VTIVPYMYPNQIANKIYQCGSNPYTFKDSTVNGVLPFTYEVMDTQPLYLPLMAGPQTANFFTVPAGSNLDSISVKVKDFCGNSNTKTFPVEKLSDCSTLNVSLRPDKELLDNRVVKVYPNPSRNRFVVSISQKKKSNFRIEILNAVGIKFYDQQLYNVDKRDLLISEALVPGIYIINVVDLQSGKASVYKQIVQ